MQEKYNEFMDSPIRKIETVKVALYLRLSRDDGDKNESNSITNQRNILTTYVEQIPEFKIEEIYVDDGFSGTNFNRPDFMRMMDDIYEGKINCVIVKDLSRLGRNYSETARYIDEIFPRLNIRFIALNNSIDTASSTMNAATQCISVGVTNVINESLAATTSVNVRATLNHNRQQGKFIGSFACYGYKKSEDDHHKLVIDPETAPIIRDIFNRFISGESILSITRHLNTLGIPNPSAYKSMNNPNYKPQSNSGLWVDSTVRRILSNEMYIGNMVQGKNEKISYKIKQNRSIDKNKWIIVENTHQPIIDQDTFNKAQSLFNKSTRISPKADSVDLFSGFMRCSNCNYTLNKKTNTHSYGTYEYYRCTTRTKKGKNTCECGHTIRIDKLEKAVLKSLQFMIKTAVNMDEIIKSANLSGKIRTDETLLERKLQKESSQLEKYKSAMVDLYPDYKCGILSQDEYLLLKSNISEKITSLQKEITKTQEQIKKCHTGAVEENDFIASFKKYGTIEKLTRPMLVELLDCILVHKGGDITIRWKFRDAYQDALTYLAELQNQKSA